MNKKDLAKMAKKLTMIDEEAAGQIYQKNQERLKILVDLVILVAAIVIFMMILFNNPDMNYVPLLILTCAVTGLAIVRAFAHGNRISETNATLRKLEEEAKNLNAKIDKGKPKEKEPRSTEKSLPEQTSENASESEQDQPEEIDSELDQPQEAAVADDLPDTQEETTQER